VKDRKSSLGSNGGRQEPTRHLLTAPEREDLASRVLSHFDKHQPEPTSFPAMASRVIDLAEHPDVDINRLAHLIERDPAICAAVLSVANSAAHRRSSAVQSVRIAIGLLGLKRVASIAVGVACRSLFDVELRVEHELFPNWWGRLFHAAMTEAFAASFVAMERARGASESIFLGGLLHNIGKSLSLRSLATLLISGQVQGIPDDESIEEVLRRTRVSIGVSALTAFNMPESLVLLCRRQDDEDLPSAEEWTDLYIVRLVSALNDLRMATVDTQAPIRQMLGSARAMQLRSEDILAIARQVKEHAAQVELLFSVADGADETGYLEFVARCLEDAG
jgi:HD-like signal output (HDOD) protein